MKKLLLMTMSLCLVGNLSFAQGPGHHGPHHKQHNKQHPKLTKEGRAELQQFDKETVYPVKKAAHSKLMAQLSAEDRAFLDEKRVEEKALRKEMHALHKEMRGLKESGKSKEEMRAAMKEKMAPQKEKMKAFMESMKPFMERNQDLVKATMEGLKTNHEEWKVAKKAIIDKHLSDEQKEKMDARKKKMAEKRAAHPEKMEKHEKHGKAMHAVKFVLWDGEMKTPHHKKDGKKRDCNKKDCPKKDKGENKENSSSAAKIEQLDNAKAMNLTAYPNPAISQTTIVFELQEATKKVELTITDAQGKQMLKKVYNKLDAGEQKLDVDLSRFANGQYFYTIEINGEQISKTLMVNQ